MLITIYGKDSEIFSFCQRFLFFSFSEYKTGGGINSRPYGQQRAESQGRAFSPAQIMHKDT
jgi:hypothetical protein